MGYTPMTPDEAAKLNLRDEGIYAFEVVNAVAGTSKEKGNPMIALELAVFDTDGSRFAVKDWLVHSDNRWAEKKVYDFAQATGLQAQYAAGTMCAEDCLSRTGFVMIGIEKGKAKQDGSGNFPDRNKVKFYSTNGPDGKAGATTSSLPPSSTQPTQPQRRPAPVENLDEDVPF